MVAVAAIVVAAIVLVSVLVLLLPGSKSGSNAGALTFYEARSIANATATAHGNWTLSDATGFDTASIGYSNLTWDGIFPDCNFTSFSGGLPRNVTWAAYRGSLSSGAAESWQFNYYQPTTKPYNPNELEVIENAGDVVAAFELSGPNCDAGQTSLSLGPLGSVVDSSAATQSALAAGGSYFLKTHPTGVSMSMAVGSRPGWTVYWRTCTLFPDAYGWVGNGSAFGALENDTTGTILPRETYNGTCGSTPPIAEGVGFGTPTLFQGSSGGTLSSQGCQALDYCYSVPISRTSFNVTPGDLSLGVDLNNMGDNDVVGYAILNNAGQVVVSESGTGTGAGSIPPDTPWTPGVGSQNSLLTTSMRLVVDMGAQDPAGVGYVLTVEGWGPSFELSPYFPTSLP
jgi:hypothetical protein